VESRRFYYHADTIGLMIWQDMPAPECSPNDNATYAQVQDIYASELARLVVGRRHHPSIIQRRGGAAFRSSTRVEAARSRWDLFNEGCLTKGPGAHEVDQAWFARASAIARQANDSRLVDVCSGCDDAGFGDVTDGHHYAHDVSRIEAVAYNATDLHPAYVGECVGFVNVLEDWCGRRGTPRRASRGARSSTRAEEGTRHP